MSEDQGGVSRPVPPLKRWVQPGVLVVALVCAVIAPRALTLTGLELTAPLEFPDAICHLYNVDLLHKVASARAADQQDPFFAEHPEQSTPQNPAALARLIKGGVSLRPFTEDVMVEAKRAAFEIYEEQAQEPGYRKIYEEWKRFRTESYRWFATAELAYASFAFPRD